MTSKEKVLSAHPNAKCKKRDLSIYHEIKDGSNILGIGETISEAWGNAAIPTMEVKNKFNIGSLYIDKGGSNIIMCTGEGKSESGYNCFSGTVIWGQEENEFFFKKGIHSLGWTCESFVEFNVDINFFLDKKVYEYIKAHQKP